MEKTINHSGRAHALLSPSAAHRWIHCTAAPLLESTVPDAGSPYAAEGTRAHELCEMLLNGGETKTLDAALRDAGAEMAEAALTYRDYVGTALYEIRRGTPDAKLIVEAKLDMRQWIPECWGTGDALIIGDGVMEVVDFKYGKGVRVDAEENAQMMLYALGAMASYGDAYYIDRVRMTIVQPRLGSVSTWETTATSLTAWAEETVRPAAVAALSGKGVERAGTWCRFCKVKATCRALAQLAEHTAAEAGASALLTTAELARLLPVVELLSSWGDAVKKTALDRALQGEKVPGYKVVEGRSVRVISDPATLAARLTGAGYAEAAVYKPRELQTLGALERLAGKKAFAALAEGCVIKPQGKPTLVEENDKRPEWAPTEGMFDGVKIE